MAHQIHIHVHHAGGVSTHDFNPSEHPRGGRGQFGAGQGKPFQHGEHPRNGGGIFTQGSHPGERSERQKRERTDLVSNQDAFEEAKHSRNAGKFATSQGAGAASEAGGGAPAQPTTKQLFAAKNPGASATSAPRAAMSLLEKIPDILPLAQTGREESLTAAKKELQEGKSQRAVEVTILDNGKPAITDGRHLRAAAKELGIKDLPVEVVRGKSRLTGARAITALEEAVGK